MVNARPERRFADLHDLGHFVVAKFFGVPQEERLSHRLGETRERIANAPPSFLLQKNVNLIRRRGCAEGGCRVGVSTRDLVGAKAVTATIACCRDQSDDERAGQLVFAAVCPNGDPCLLGQLGADIGIIRKTRTDLHDSAGMPLDQRGECFAHACLGQRHQLVVGALFRAEPLGPARAAAGGEAS